MKAVRHSATLDYYDGPILFEARDRIGGHYLAAAADTRGDQTLFAVVGVSPERLDAFRRGRVDLRDLMVEAGSEEWYVGTQNRTTEEFDLELQRTELLTSVYLPKPGYKLDAGTSSEAALLDEAQRRDNLVIELKAEPSEAAGGHRIRLDSLVELLDLMRKLVRHAYSAERRESAAGVRSAVPVGDAVRMDVVVPAMPGSFRMLLEAGGYREDSEERELSRGLRRVDSLFERAARGNAGQTVALLGGTRGHLAGTYLKLLDFLGSQQVGLHYAWAEPTFSRTRQQSITAVRAGRLSQAIAGMVESGIEDVALEGTLVKADLKTRAWRLESGRAVHRGTAGHVSMLDGLTVGKWYRFFCIAETGSGKIVGREEVTLHLERAEEVSRAT